MSRRRIAIAVLGLAVAGSQAGHLLAYELRFGSAAQQMQSTGAHAYFPSVAKTLFGAAAMLLIASLLLVGFARLASGRRIEPGAAPSLLRLLAVLYTLQLGLFVAQETVEGSPASRILLWGLLGQMPVALVGAVALRWLLARLAPALAGLRTRYEAPLQPVPIPTSSWTAPAVALVPARRLAGPITRRGPPAV